MFERYLADALATHFGHVIENLDQDKIRLSAWNGELILKDLTIRKHALCHFFKNNQENVKDIKNNAIDNNLCPFDIAYGHIGNLEVRIPWKKLVQSKLLFRSNVSDDVNDLQSQELQLNVILSDINILISPRIRRENNTKSNNTRSSTTSTSSNEIPEIVDTVSSSDTMDEEESEIGSFSKEKLVQAALGAEILRRVTISSRQQEQSTSATKVLSNSTNSSWIQERIAAILSNLSVTIKNIHIRYEDPGTCMGFVWNFNPESEQEQIQHRYRNSFAIGITLKEFSIQSASPVINDDERGTKEFINSTKSTIENNHDDTESSTANMNQKVAIASQLASYWDSSCKIIMSDRGKHLDKDLKAKYFQSTFSLLNDGCIPSNSMSSTLKNPLQASYDSEALHTFILKPCSPSIHVSIADKIPKGDSDQLPVSTMTVVLPPCQIKTSRSMLEDLGYLRKSIDVWVHSQKGTAFSEKTLRKITSLKPNRSPLIDKSASREWWKYLYEAVLALQAISNKKEGFDTITSTKNVKRRKGWLGLAQLLGYRKRYVWSFTKFLQQVNEKDRLKSHQEIVSLERELLINEIVQFRITSYESIRLLNPNSDEMKALKNVFIQIQMHDVSDDLSEAIHNTNDDFSAENRFRMYIEMAQGLERERLNAELKKEAMIGTDNDCIVKEYSKNVLWKSSLQCPEFSLQVDDDNGIDLFQLNSHQAIARLSFALDVEHELCADGSWNMTGRIGSLVLRDCTFESHNEIPVFPNLIGPKGGNGAGKEYETFYIGEISYHQSVLINLRRSWNSDSIDIVGSTNTTNFQNNDSKDNVGSTTNTNVRVLPLELVYSTSPIEALSRVFEVTNLEFADDYHRLSSRLTAWRQSQQKRLLQALAHRQKKILIDLDVGAPVLLVPEATNCNSQLLIVYLGRLRFINDDNRKQEITPAFDDKWSLHLSDIQLQSSTTYAYRGLLDVDDDRVSIRQDYTKNQQLIEPFSLNFSIFTKIQEANNYVPHDNTLVRILATLPSLVFNLTSSSVRLFDRIQNQWAHRKMELKGRLPHSQSKTADDKSGSTSISTSQQNRSVSGRCIEFHFNAPMFRLRFENDINGRNKNTTALFDFVLKGMECYLTHESDGDGMVKISCSAKVQTISAFDLYQTAGEDFALLLSSISPSLVDMKSLNDDKDFNIHDGGTDLVTFEFSSSFNSSRDLTEHDMDSFDTLTIQFNELFVEWNPETLSAISKAFTKPTVESKDINLVNNDDNNTSRRSECDNVDAYFDAEEDDFYDASCVEVEDHVLLSRSEPTYNSPDVCRSASTSKISETDEVITVSRYVKPFQITFTISKLQVTFNKDVRHRKVFIAEMDKTFIQRTSYEPGRSKTTVSMGNLTFADCECLNNKTLYREVLGLTTDGNNGGCESSSLLEMEISTYPRSLVRSPLKDYQYGEEKMPTISVDSINGEVSGFDTYFRATLSPMRFVYIQQFWLEIVDYFFEGILGYEVWGKTPPSLLDLDILESTEITADMISFTKFDVEMSSPVILIPVACCSTDFIRLEASKIKVKNTYTYRAMRRPEQKVCIPTDLSMQWFNNCKIHYSGLQIKSWSGSSFTDVHDRPNASITLCWPVGPKAILNVAKWKVDCNIDFLHLKLQREDYALLQHVVQYNIGAETHHIEEWVALQSLRKDIRTRYEESISVRFSYDQKDVIPSTFDVKLQCPSISFVLLRCAHESVAVIGCSNFCWEYIKLKDRISRQKVSCNIEILCPDNGTLLLYSENRFDDAQKTELCYSSVVNPSDNVSKTLKITNACIHVIYGEWKRLLTFFQGLPLANYLMPDQVIQVGDRWYKIGEISSVVEHHSDFRWLEGYDARCTENLDPETTTNLSEFHFVLIDPSIRVGSNTSSLVLSMATVKLKQDSDGDILHRVLDLTGVQVRTSVSGQQQRSSELSLIQPWDLIISSECRNCRQPVADMLQSLDVKAKTLNARAAFSDMHVAMEVGMKFLEDVKSTNDVAAQQLDGESINSNSSNAISISHDPIMYPRMNVMELEWDGLSFVIIDDSRRHFANDQNLIIVSLEKVFLKRVVECIQPALSSRQETSKTPLHFAMRLYVGSLRVVDCLQSESSPYREIIMILPEQVCPNPDTTVSVGSLNKKRRTTSNVDSRPIPKVVLQVECIPAIDFWSDVSDTKIYGIKTQSIEVQYNPSVVIALQRFLGRLGKDANNLFHTDTQISEEPHLNGGNKSTSQVICVYIESKKFNICLNKEHQGRRLAVVTISDMFFDLRQDEEGSRIQGSVGNFTAMDPSFSPTQQCAVIANSSCSKGAFITFRYWTFPKRILPKSDCFQDLPNWILLHQQKNQNIDDLLDISISTMEIVYLQARTEELIDYLGNGMPGKGMGVTSRAAKGFVSDRIQKQSFFNVLVDAPKLDIPIGQADSLLGLSFRLGDFHLKSWIEEKTSKKAAPRIVLAALSGVSGSACEIVTSNHPERHIVKNIDVSLTVELTPTSFSLSSTISDVMVRLTYKDYESVLGVWNTNIGKKPDKKSWENLEVAWEEESKNRNDTELANEVAYSSSARYVRYGQNRESPSNTKAINMKLSFSSISLLLRRNDLQLDSESEYDMLFIRCQGFEGSVERKTEGDLSASISLNKIFVFDLGQLGRARRLNVDTLSTDMIIVMIQGYCPVERRQLQKGSESFDSQIVLKMDKDATESGTIRVTLVISYLRFVPMIGALREITNFFSCAWSESNTLDSNNKQSNKSAKFQNSSKPEGTNKGQEFQIRFVLHYPQLVLAADEGDFHSRALVLHGLAIANASQESSVLPPGTAVTSKKLNTLKINADFQNVSSYIHPDIASIIGLNVDHVTILKKILSPVQISSSSVTSEEDVSMEDDGVPLLLPLTIGVEFEQSTQTGSPTNRILGINVDPVSIIVTSEDLHLLKSVATKVSTKTNSTISFADRHYSAFYDVTFTTVRLGLGLKKENGRIVVDSIGDSEKQISVTAGDMLYAINDVVVDASAIELSSMVTWLTLEPRPLKLRFVRSAYITEQEVESKSVSIVQNTSHFGTVDKVDISLSAAVLTLMEREVPLFKGSLRTSRVSCHLEQSNETKVNIDFSSTICVEYYNLHVWEWEPLFEPGDLYVSTTYLDLSGGIRELAIEVGDRGSGLCLNISDAFTETFSKALEWGKTSSNQAIVDDIILSDFALSDPSDRKPVISKKAANAALRYATRQKNDMSIPFVFRNMTGLSIAFVQQRKDEASQHYPHIDFESLGVYNGLEMYDPSDVMIVASGEELKFRVNISTDDSHSGSEKREHEKWARFPLLTVALQETKGVTTDPFTDLQIVYPGVTLVPLCLTFPGVGNDFVVPERIWAVWSVEQAAEKTVLTIGSSIRFFSQINQPLEVGVQVGKPYDNTEVKVIGTVQPNELFYIPLWLAMQQQQWRCSIKLERGFCFAPICEVSAEGFVSFGALTTKSIECSSQNTEDVSSCLAVTQQVDGDILTISIECSMILRNLLPTNVEWEAFEILEQGESHHVYSPTHVKGEDNIPIHSLQSGENAELYTNGSSSVKLRVRPGNVSNWSSWILLDFPKTVINENRSSDPLVEGNYADDTKNIFIVKTRDALNHHLPIGVRIIRRNSGLDVTLYTEIWCTNCTALNIVFGCQREQIAVNEITRRSTKFESVEMSPAEAALKEISSLFDGGYDVTGSNETDRRIKNSSKHIVRLGDQCCPFITEEYFEYVEMDGSVEKKRWWASEDPSFLVQDSSPVKLTSSTLGWIDKTWIVDKAGNTADGWESSSNTLDFSPTRTFNPTDKIRRRRWFRTRAGLRQGAHVDGVNAYFHSLSAPLKQDEKNGKKGIKIAIQVDGGKWALTSTIPIEGTTYGAIRATKARWPQAIGNSQNNEVVSPHSVYEMCYAVNALDGDWGLLSRNLIVTSRFLLRNDSSKVVLQVKQTGAPDTAAVEIGPGQRSSFHWSNIRLPELISVRPAFKIQGKCIYKWSGGFDPLTIGPVPLRIRKYKAVLDTPTRNHSHDDHRIRSIKMEAEIRPRTGGTGITLSFQEEDGNGDVALFRIENLSTFPIWLQQDGILSNPVEIRDDAERDGDLLRPTESSVFALDVPFRQGKYSHRKAATMRDLLRIRLGLAPLSSRAGIETMKAVSLTNVGERVRLNPSKLQILTLDLRSSIENVCIIGAINNDGPTRVLSLRLAEKYATESDFTNPFTETPSVPSFFSSSSNSELPAFGHEIFDGAYHAAQLSKKRLLPSEDGAVSMPFTCKILSNHYPPVDEKNNEDIKNRDLVISVRASFSGLVVSLIDSAPIEIALLTLKNINCIATWNTKRTTDSTVFITVTSVQLDNMLPNAPFPVAICPDDNLKANPEDSPTESPPLLVLGLSFAPKHKSGIVCLKSVTIAPRNLAIRVDLAFLVRIQKFFLDIQGHFQIDESFGGWSLQVPDINTKLKGLDAAAASSVGSQKFYFGGLTILPCNIKLSVSPARALTSAQAALEGEEAAAIHQAVRKGDVRIDKKSILGVKLGGRNKTPLAVVRGMLKSFVVDALLRLDGASLNFAGVALSNHTSTGSQLTTALGAHYMASLRQNLPALLGSMAALGNPLGLVKGLGDGVSDFVLEPVKGLQRSVQEMDASYLVDGVAKGTLSLARHTVGGFADSAAMLAETFSKNMTVLTLDRRYAQKRDRGELLRDHDDINVALGLGSGVQKFVNGFLDGVTGVVKAPIRGAEKRGFEGFAKGIGKGLLGLLVKPIIGISDGFGDVMLGVKGSVEGVIGHSTNQLTQTRPRRAMYGRDRTLRLYNIADAAAASLMNRTRLAGELYFTHVDMGDRVALLSITRLLIIGLNGKELLVLKFKHVESVELRTIHQINGKPEWGIIILLNTPRKNGSELEVITCYDQIIAETLSSQIEIARQAMLAEGILSS